MTVIEMIYAELRKRDVGAVFTAKDIEVAIGRTNVSSYFTRMYRCGNAIEPVSKDKNNTITWRTLKGIHKPIPDGIHEKYRKLLAKGPRSVVACVSDVSEKKDEKVVPDSFRIEIDDHTRSIVEEAAKSHGLSFHEELILRLRRVPKDCSPPTKAPEPVRPLSTILLEAAARAERFERALMGE